MSLGHSRGNTVTMQPMISSTAPPRSAPRRADKAAIGLGIVFALFAIGLPIALIVVPAPATSIVDPGNFAISLVLLVYASIRLAIIIARGEPRLIVSMVWFFIYISMAVVPLAQIHTGAFGLTMDKSLLAVGQLICLVAMLTFDATSSIRPRSVVRVDHGRRLSTSRLAVISLFALAASAFYIVTIGGPSVFFESRRDLGSAFEDAGLRGGSQVGSALLMTLGTIPVFVCLLCWGLLAARDRTRRRSVGTWVWIVLLLTLNVIVNNPITNARYWMLTILLGVLFARPGLTRRAFRGAIVIGLLAALVVFPYSDYFRATADNRSAIHVKPIDEMISTKDYDQVTMTANGVWYVDQYGNTFGSQISSALLFFVPRQVWPTKGLDTGVMIGEAMQAGNVNLSSPLWIEFWVDFSWPGVVIGFGLLGLLASRVDRRFVDALDSSRLYVRAIDVLAPLLAGYSLILLRGPLLQSMSRLSVMLLTIWLLFPKGKDTPAE